MIRLLRYVWAGPATLLGLVVAFALLRRGRAAIVDGVIEAHSPLLGRALRSCAPLAGGAIAMTLGHVVIGQNASALDLTRAHERVHVRQYELWGPFFLPAYLLAGVFELLRGRHPYIDNYFERDARDAEKGVGRVFARRARIGTKNRGGTVRPGFSRFPRKPSRPQQRQRSSDSSASR